MHENFYSVGFRMLDTFFFWSWTYMKELYTIHFLCIWFSAASVLPYPSQLLAKPIEVCSYIVNVIDCSPLWQVPIKFNFYRMQIEKTIRIVTQTIIQFITIKSKYLFTRVERLHSKKIIFRLPMNSREDIKKMAWEKLCNSMTKLRTA